MTVMRRLDTRAADFTSRLAALTRFEATLDEAVERTVAGILADVHLRGDAAVVDYTNRFDRQHVTELAQLRIAPEQLAGAHAGLPAEQKDALAGRFIGDHLSFKITFPEDRNYDKNSDYYFVLNSLQDLVTSYRNSTAAVELSDKSNVVKLSLQL